MSSVVNPLKLWRDVITPTPPRTVGQVKALKSGDRVECELRSGTKIDAIGAGYNIGDSVLIQDGRIVRQVSSLPVTSQGV